MEGFEKHYQLFEEGITPRKGPYSYGISSRILETFHLSRLEVFEYQNSNGFVKLEILEVDEKFRGRGYGSAFIKSFCEWMHTKGKTVCLHANGLTFEQVNRRYIEGLKAFYHKLGFADSNSSVYSRGCSAPLYYCPEKTED